MTLSINTCKKNKKKERESMAKKELDAFSKQAEEKVQAFWKKNDIMEKSRNQHRKAKQKFYFMDGPPYATGYIHMGTALNKILKDIAMRSHRLQGFDVFDRPGYDTHGLPIENKVEQKMGFKSKQDIEDFGIEKFVQECRKFATEFIDIQNQQYIDLGVWMDWKNPYITLSREYIDALWWTFQKAEEKGLLYLGAYPVHVCSHCETAVAYNEIEYTKQTDTSVYVKFKVRGTTNKYLIIWTTTPWTLPGNTGIMVHPKYEYVEAEVGNEVWIVAKERLEELMRVLEAGYRILKTVPGKELEGMRYDHPSEHLMKRPKKVIENRVVLSERYVHLEDGTGLVHTAPGHGKEDFDAGTKTGLPAYCPVGVNGLLTAETGKYAGKKARMVDAEIIEDLQKEGALVYQHPYTHDYPICWRCKNPLLMVSVPQWFFKVTTIQKRLLELNQETEWVPEWMQDRMKNWLEGIGDWPISRSRYWGTPLPIWVCEKCGKRKVFGSIAEAEKESGKKIPDPHKPWIDAITIPCSECRGTMKRIPEVLDVWFDAGASSWAALEYPKRKDLFEQFWPADLNLEGTEQVRGWWNSEIICSTICFDQKPFKSIAVHGMVLDLAKKKMSKSQGGFLEPKQVTEQFSRDYLRYFLAKKSTGTDMTLDWKEMDETKKFFTILYNTYKFAELYLSTRMETVSLSDKALSVEDQWLVSRTNSVVNQCLAHYNQYEFFKAVNLLETFILEDVSRTYIKAVRDRIGTPSEKGTEKALGHCLYKTLQLLAPITPYLSEHFYQSFRSEKEPESIHLTGIATVPEKETHSALEKEFEKAKELLQNALALREEQKMKLRWPLKELVIVTKTGSEFKLTQSFIQSMANVKEVTETKMEPKEKLAEKTLPEYRLFLDVSADQELKNEWELTELRRRIQELRKQSKLQPGKVVQLELDCSEPAFVSQYKKQLEEETRTKIVSGKGKREKLLEREFFLKLHI
jgi:isoleucyl-tRNA synthetase